MGGHLIDLLARIEQPDLCGLCPKAINRVTDRSSSLSRIARETIELLEESRAVEVLEVLADSLYD